MIDTNKIHLWDCLEVMKLIDDSSIDCIITDPPFLNFYSIPSVIDILDTKLWEVLSYVWYECTMMKLGWSVEIKWKEHKIPWSLKWFLRYCKLEDLLINK